MKAIALLEVQAMVAAITGLDAMVKAADVKLIHVEKRLGGRLVTIVVEGEVSAVTAALEAGRVAAAEVGKVLPALFYFLKIVLASQGLFWFHTNLRIICSSSVNNIMSI